MDEELARVRRQNPNATCYRDAEGRIRIVGKQGVAGGGKGGDVIASGPFPFGTVIRGGDGGNA